MEQLVGVFWSAEKREKSSFVCYEKGGKITLCGVAKVNREDGLSAIKILIYYISEWKLRLKIIRNTIGEIEFFTQKVPIVDKRMRLYAPQKR